MVPRSQDSPRRKRSRKTGARAAAGELVIRRLTPSRMDELGEVLRGGWGKGCWCIFPRVTAALERELPGPGSGSDRRRRAMEKLARRRRALGRGVLHGRVDQGQGDPPAAGPPVNGDAGDHPDVHVVDPRGGPRAVHPLSLIHI